MTLSACSFDRYCQFTLLRGHSIARGHLFPLLERRCSVIQSYLTLCGPMDCSLSGSSALGIFQARILVWYILLQGIFLIQKSNMYLPHCRRILHQLSNLSVLANPIDDTWDLIVLLCFSLLYARLSPSSKFAISSLSVSSLHCLQRVLGIFCFTFQGHLVLCDLSCEYCSSF